MLRRDTPVEKLKKWELQEEVRVLRGEVKRDEARIENLDHKYREAESLAVWLVSIAFPDISLTRDVTSHDYEGYGLLRSFPATVTYTDPDGVKRLQQVRKSVGELDQEIEEKLERDKFEAMTQKQQLQYLFDQKQSRDGRNSSTTR